MLSSAQKHILLVDHSKFGAVSATQHATLEDIDLLITDSDTPMNPASSASPVLVGQDL